MLSNSRAGTLFELCELSTRNAFTIREDLDDLSPRHRDDKTRLIAKRKHGYMKLWKVVSATYVAISFGLGVSSAQTPAPAGPSRVPHPMGFFVTSSMPSGSGNLGGLTGADKICQDLAASAGAGNRTWHAYLSTQPSATAPGENARDRIGAGPWYNAKNALIAANVEDLHGDIARDRNNIQKSSALTEKGDLIKGIGDTPNQHDILTGSDSEGRAFPTGIDATCNNWTSDGDDHKAMLGHADRSGGDNTSWNSNHMSTGCSAAKLIATGGAGHLYCFATN
jgi:hypothetical protein